MFKFLWSITPIGAVANLMRIAHEHENQEVRETTIGWQIDQTYTEDPNVPQNKPAEYYRVIRTRRDVKDSIKARLPKLVKVYED